MSNVKLAHDMFLSTGLLSYFTASDFANVAKGGIDVIGSSVSNAYNRSDDQFRDTGEGIGELVGSAGMGAANLEMLYHTAKIHGRRRAFLGDGGIFRNKEITKSILGGPTAEAKAVFSKSGAVGRVYNELEGGGFKFAGRVENGKFTPFTGEAQVVAEESALGRVLGSSKASKGFLKEGMLGDKQFIGDRSMWKNARWFVGAMAAGYLAKSILGFAGGIVDEAVRDYRREKSHHYDNRFFNTQRDEMSNYGQLGMAMNNYENRFQSTARIYHSR